MKKNEAADSSHWFGHRRENGKWRRLKLQSSPMTIDLIAMKRESNGDETCCDTEPFDDDIEPDFYTVFVSRYLPGGKIEVIEEKDFTEYQEADRFRQRYILSG